MGSNKPSARAKRRAQFEAGFGGMDDLFDRESDRLERDAALREEALRDKACESKNRYATRAEALEAIERCAERGRRGLHCYRCSYCNGWHLTSKPLRS